MCAFMCVRFCLRLFVCARVCLCACVSVFVCVNTRVCLFVCARACMCVCMGECVCVETHKWYDFDWLCFRCLCLLSQMYVLDGSCCSLGFVGCVFSVKSRPALSHTHSYVSSVFT